MGYNTQSSGVRREGPGKSDSPEARNTVPSNLPHPLTLHTESTSSALPFFQGLHVNVQQAHRQASWKTWSCVFQNTSTHRNYPLTCLSQVIYVLCKSTISCMDPKSQGRKKNAFTDKKMQLLHVDSVKGSKNSTTKCLKFMVLKKLSWKPLINRTSFNFVKWFVNSVLVFLIHVSKS